MSGGVDSSVAAALLQEQGWTVEGVFMTLGIVPADDALRVGEALGIAVHVLDVAQPFAAVQRYFQQEYLAGRTPNPCIRCNVILKFGYLMDWALQQGFDAFATGHYARIDCSGESPCIRRGVDPAKDQAYALFGIDRRRLPRIHLPIGGLDDKAQTREIARSLNLPVHAKPDSQEICFIPDDDYVAYLAEHAPDALQPGEIVTTSGEVVGTHEGYGQFTIGQRRGVGVAAGVPMYVVGIDPATARVTIGPREAARHRTLSAAGSNFHADTPDRFEATVQVRYNHRGQPGVVTRNASDTFDVEFRQDVHAITPGQAAVLFDGDRLLGGGWIDHAQ